MTNSVIDPAISPTTISHVPIFARLKPVGLYQPKSKTSFASTLFMFSSHIVGEEGIYYIKSAATAQCLTLDFGGIHTRKDLRCR